MSRRTSSRARKIVDYTQSGGDMDEDDDFASSSAPASKRTKTAAATTTRKTDVKQPSKTIDNNPHKTEPRLPLDEKLFERDLQKALQLSSQTGSTQPQETVELRTTPTTTIVGSDNVTATTAAAAAAGDGNQDNDADYNAKNEDSTADADDDDDDDYSANDSSASEFGSHKVNKFKAVSSTGTDQRLTGCSAQTKRSTTTNTKGVNKPRKNSNKSVSTTTTRRPTTTTTGLCSSKSPPSTSTSRESSHLASSNKSTNLSVSSVSSPSSGLRLGLSRNVKVKPLHRSLHAAVS